MFDLEVLVVADAGRTLTVGDWADWPNEEGRVCIILGRDKGALLAENSPSTHGLH